MTTLQVIVQVRGIIQCLWRS